MPIAAILALLRAYGPTVVSLVEEDGPALWALVQAYGPKICVFAETYGPGALAYLSASAKAGMLQHDMDDLVTKGQRVLALLGPITSVADMMAALDSIGPADLGNPAPDSDRLLGSKHR